jgi:hypothetical protein
MTLALNLLERSNDEYYGLEYMDYIVLGEGIFDDPISDNLEDYLKKYPNDIRRTKKKYQHLDLTNKFRLAVYVAMERQDRCRRIFFEVLNKESENWWD